MNIRFAKKLEALKTAVITADAHAALACLEDLEQIARRGLDDADRAAFEPKLAQIRELAEVSGRAARDAIDEVRAIIQAARSLQTYDASGQRQAASTAAPAPHRF